MLNLILYAVLGMILAMAGVSIIEKPAYFCLIMFVVVAIDLSSKFKG